MVQEIESNNNFAQAQNLGSLNSSLNTREVTGRVSLSDVNDVFKFRLGNGNSASDLELILEQNSSNNSDADLELFRDVNGNNLLDKGDFVINAFEQPQGSTKRLELGGLTGVYFARVRMDRGSDVGRGPIDYELTVNSEAGKRQEQEPNNSVAQADRIEGFLNGLRQIEGSVNKTSDVSDFYKFEVETPSKLTASISGFEGSKNMNFFLGKDFNGNGNLESNELIGNPSSTLNTRANNHERLETGTYFLRIDASTASSGTVDYNLFLNATPIRREDFSVKVERLTAKDDFEGFFDDGTGQADFRISVNAGRNTGNTRQFEEKNDLFPNFEVTDIRTSQLSRHIPFSISVKEDDQFRDDNVDIDPNGGLGLELSYDTLNQKITGEGIVAREGDLITVRGDGDAGDAEIQFRVNLQTFT